MDHQNREINVLLVHYYWYIVVALAYLFSSVSRSQSFSRGLLSNTPRTRCSEHAGRRRGNARSLLLLILLHTAVAAAAAVQGVLHRDPQNWCCCCWQLVLPRDGINTGTRSCAREKRAGRVVVMAQCERSSSLCGDASKWMRFSECCTIEPDRYICMCQLLW